MLLLENHYQLDLLYKNYKFCKNKNCQFYLLKNISHVVIKVIMQILIN